MTRLAVLQPSYLPWLGHLEQIGTSDVFVFYDDVQFDKNGWRNRNRIRTESKEGWSWLTLPVLHDEHFPPIDRVRIDARMPWRRKHRRALEAAYARAPHRELLSCLDSLFAGESENLADVAIASTRALLDALDIATPLYRSSELGIGGDRNERLLNLCKHFGATHYYSGAAARAYLDVALFEREGITVEWQDYQHPAYEQVREPFVSHLSAIDALLCVGTDARKFVTRD
ncbi:MAG: WbqC family protein [Candidatus Eremiobacteraeota bacterium]|nr:WbqC family protein [Candidatus Eremiobacteraeota bacterium]